MSKHIAITGNIGSGKSTVARFFKLLDIPVYNADVEARKFLASPKVIDEIVATLGNQILDDQGQIIKSEMAKIIFNDKDKLEAINEIIHPKVIADYKEWSHKLYHPAFTLFESAIILERGLEKHFDAVIDVYCPEEIAIKRASTRDGVTAELIRERMKNQMNSESKRDKADFVVFTNDRQSIIEQVLDIKSKISDKTDPNPSGF